MKFSLEEFEQVRSLLIGDRGGEAIRQMHDHAFGKSPEGGGLIEEFRAFGWVDPNGHLTDKGLCVSASCREYTFWVGRDRAFPFRESAPELVPEYFSGKTVVEIGSGIGANLMTLHGHAECIGVEPFEIHMQMGQIFSEIEGIPAPETKVATGEDMPLPDASCDVALCVAAHHYFDICPALHEISRVLKPDGELFVFGWTLAGFLKSFRSAPLKASCIKHNGIALINTLSYSALRRRVLPPRSSMTTTRPIYPPLRSMKRWMTEAGIRPCPDLQGTGPDRYIQGRKMR